MRSIQVLAILICVISAPIILGTAITRADDSKTSETAESPNFRLCRLLVHRHYSGPLIGGLPAADHLRVIEALQQAHGLDEKVLRKISYTPQLYPVVLEFPQFLNSARGDLVQERLKLTHALERVRTDRGFDGWAPSIWIETIDGTESLSLGMSLRPNVADQFFDRLVQAQVSVERIEINALKTTEDTIHISFPNASSEKVTQLLRLFFSR